MLAEPAPPGPLAAQVAKVRMLVDDARIQVAAGRFERASVLADGAIAQSRDLAFRPLLAEALLVGGHATMAMDRRAEAVPMLAEATTVALEVGSDALGVEAWARRAWAQATSGDYASALAGLDVIEALAARIPAGQFARTLLHNNVGSVELTQEHRAKARASFERALEESRSVVGPGAVELVNVRTNLGLTADDPEQRDRLFGEAVDELAKLLGEDHPETLQARWSRGATSVPLARALELLVPTCEKLDLHEALVARKTKCWTEVGHLYDELGRGAEAVMAADRAVRACGGARSSCPEAIPYLLLWQGNASAAARAFQTAVAESGPKSGDEPWWKRLALAELQLGLARALRNAGQLQAARETLETSVATMGPIAHDHPIANIERRLGRAYVERAHLAAATGGTAADVAATARAAVAWLREVGGPAAEIGRLERLISLPPSRRK
jgi:tetratricopeptide (TPR) repeat protein